MPEAPVFCTVFRAVGVIDGESLCSVASDDDEMPAVGEVSGADHGDDGAMAVQRLFQLVFFERELSGGEPQQRTALTDQRPATAASRDDITVVGGKVGHIGRVVAGIMSQ